MTNGGILLKVPTGGIPMYEIIREDDRVIIKKGDTPVFNAKKDWYVIYEKDGHPAVAKVGDLPNEALLMALSNALPLKV